MLERILLASEVIQKKSRLCKRQVFNMISYFRVANVKQGHRDHQDLRACKDPLGEMVYPVSDNLDAMEHLEEMGCQVCKVLWDLKVLKVKTALQVYKVFKDHKV